METKDKAAFHILLVQAVAFKDNKVLIAQRGLDEVQSPGLWSFPGGKVEHYGDDLYVVEKTLMAEFMEEVGIELKPRMDYLRSGSFVRGDGAPVVSLTFVADWKKGKAQPLEDSIAVKWVGKQELDGIDFAPAVREKIEAAFVFRGL